MLGREAFVALGDAALAQDNDLRTLAERLDNGFPLFERGHVGRRGHGDGAAGSGVAAGAGLSAVSDSFSIDSLTMEALRAK